MEGHGSTRRCLLWVAGAAGAGLLLSRAGAAATIGNGREAKGEEGEEVTPGEDLMREHGVLKRILLVYRDYIARIGEGTAVDPAPLARSAKLIRSFIEEYHEKLEEDYLFPRFRKAGQLVELVAVLQAQHEAGRRLTDGVLRLADAGALRDAGERGQLRDALAQFVRMYEPHEAREDTVLFPAFARLVPRSEYDALGEEFEKKEHHLFGEGGFQGVVDQVAGIEKSLGLYDLAQYTPRV